MNGYHNSSCSSSFSFRLHLSRVRLRALRGGIYIRAFAGAIAQSATAEELAVEIVTVMTLLHIIIGYGLKGRPPH